MGNGWDGVERREIEKIEKRVGSYERHFMTVGTVIITMLLGWIGTSITDMREDMAVVKSKLPEVIQMQSALRELSERVALTEQTASRLGNDFDYLSKRVDIMAEK